MHPNLNMHLNIELFSVDLHSKRWIKSQILEYRFRLNLILICQATSPIVSLRKQNSDAFDGCPGILLQK